MPLARQALHESGEEVHVAVWPTVHELHQVASRQYAFEGRCFVLASGALMRASSLPPELEPLTTKPLLAVENGQAGIDLKLEAELAELPDGEAAAYRDGPSALNEIVRRLSDALDLITFFTAGDKETRAWTLRNGASALDAAATIHSDIARGFIRAETITWSDLLDAGSHAEASRRGTQRLEGKTYVVRDGDVLNIRFNV